jgi:hypothetical protein
MNVDLGINPNAVFHVIILTNAVVAKLPKIVRMGISDVAKIWIFVVWPLGCFRIYEKSYQHHQMSAQETEKFGYDVVKR